MTDWQDISTAPKNGTEILVFYKSSGVISIAWYDERVLQWVVSVADNGEPIWNDPYPTHWMPLPSPPKETT